MIIADLASVAFGLNCGDYQVLFADENILEGDEVQINYLPNTTWAVVQKIE